MWVVKFAFTRSRAAFPAKQLHVWTVILFKLVASQDAGTRLSRGDASFQYFSSFLRDKEEKISKVKVQKYCTLKQV